MLSNILGENYPINECERIPGKYILHVKSQMKCCECPECHEISGEYHSTYVRKIQDTPIHNTETWIYVTAYEFTCQNEKCNVETFCEILPFARKNKVKTDMLVQFILSISIFLSSTSASLILSFLGVKASADTIDNIVKNIKIVDNPNIEEVGIDDVAVRKGQTYATAIYDLKDHHMLALLDGRDADSIKEWLENHQKIKVIARDRASAYATAISEILPECTQVADRFHLFQNLVMHLKDIFYNEVPEKIFIKDNEIVDSVKKVPTELANINATILESYDYDNSELIDEQENKIFFDNKIHDLDSSQYKEQAQRRLEKRDLIKALRKRLENSSCHETKSIAEEFKISPASLRKYKKMTDVEVENIANRKNYKKRKSIMDDYINIIFKMLKDGIAQEYIMAYVIKKGYQGSHRHLRDFINLIAKNNGMEFKETKGYIKMEYPNDVVVITRYELLKHILTLNPKKNKNEIITKYMDLIVDKYPIVKDTEDIFRSFHDIIFSGNPDLLDDFIESYDSIVHSFCSGIKKDIAPVKNAISLQINSGFVEGNNNKFKLIKRIVYGKQKLCNLFKKSYLCFLTTLDDFSIEEIVSQMLNEEEK